ncbi:LysR family transcriptional regulator [Vibrio sp. 404]|uniref:LysR family transcriptional regulator n=1 Tax=Vibrio marinisediminis TaxID=2758441 RepID=A0A7W2FTY6_9VIBR|nr:LysR family transcriptional regulator [Vibrio marinisediminis]MBA5764202.1 LysR family transcriptional regulator [Vibrio marinisediminis]
MNLTYLQTFLTVAEEGSFTKAAEILDVSKGLVSRHIQRLESSLNSKLFHRSTRSISLTESGRDLLIRAQQIQLLATEAEMRVRDMAQEISGELRITAPLEFGRSLCQSVIPAYCQQNPLVEVICDFGPGKKRIELGEYDVAIRAFDTLPEDVVAKELGDMRNVLVAAPDYLASLAPVTIDNIEQQLFVLNSQNERWNHLQLVQDGETVFKQVMGNIRANTYTAILSLTQQGVGLACVPYMHAEGMLERGELVQVLPQWSVKSHKLSLIYAQRRITPSKLVKFNQAVVDWLRENPKYLI